MLCPAHDFTNISSPNSNPLLEDAIFNIHGTCSMFVIKFHCFKDYNYLNLCVLAHIQRTHFLHLRHCTSWYAHLVN